MVKTKGRNATNAQVKASDVSAVKISNAVEIESKTPIKKCALTDTDKANYKGKNTQKLNKNHSNVTSNYEKFKSSSSNQKNLLDQPGSEQDIFTESEVKTVGDKVISNPVNFKQSNRKDSSKKVVNTKSIITSLKRKYTKRKFTTADNAAMTKNINFNKRKYVKKNKLKSITDNSNIVQNVKKVNDKQQKINELENMTEKDKSVISNKSGFATEGSMEPITQKHIIESSINDSKTIEKNLKNMENNIITKEINATDVIVEFDKSKVSKQPDIKINNETKKAKNVNNLSEVHQIPTIATKIKRKYIKKNFTNKPKLNDLSKSESRNILKKSKDIIKDKKTELKVLKDVYDFSNDEKFQSEEDKKCQINKSKISSAKEYNSNLDEKLNKKLKAKTPFTKASEKVDSNMETSSIIASLKKPKKNTKTVTLTKKIECDPLKIDSTDTSDTESEPISFIKNENKNRTRPLNVCGRKSKFENSKRTRVAYLNAIAKVHCLYENESRSALETNLNLNEHMKTTQKKHIAEDTSSEEDITPEPDSQVTKR
jgi:hypothetical protein